MTGQGIAGAGRIPVLYAHAIDKAGGTPKVFSPFDQLREDQIVPDDLDLVMDVAFDDLSPLDGAVGLLLPGGGDVDPLIYGAPRHPRSRGVSRERDRLEMNLLREALKLDMPVLAICRGFQLLNVTLGGTLNQHLADNPEQMDHDRDMPRAEPVHHVNLTDGCILADMLETTELSVNSHHHQGLDRIADGVEQIGWSTDGVLEAITVPRYRWVVGVQWHPEVMSPIDAKQMRLFEEFVAATEKYAADRHAA